MCVYICVRVIGLFYTERNSNTHHVDGSVGVAIAVIGADERREMYIDVSAVYIIIVSSYRLQYELHTHTHNW